MLQQRVASFPLGLKLASPPSALLLTALAAALYGLTLPVLDAGLYPLLLPLAAAVAAVIVLRPEIGLALMFLVAPLETTHLDYGVRIKPYHVLGLLTMAGWGLQLAVNQRRRIYGSILNIPIALLVLVGLTSFILHSEFASLGYFLFVLQMWFVATIYLVANIREPEVLRRCFWAFVAAAILEAVLAAFQATGFYQEADPTTAYSAVLTKGRPLGTFTEPDFLAPFLAAGVLMMLPFLTVRRNSGRQALVQLCFVLLIMATMLTMVRASWVGLSAGGVAFAAIKLTERGQSRRLVSFLGYAARTAGAMVLVLFALSVVAPTAYSAVSVRAKNVLSIVEPENPHQTRLREVTETWEVTKEDLLTGHGIGTFGVTTEYGRKIAMGTNQTRSGVVGSGTVLGLLHDVGIVGLAAFASLIGVLLWRLWRAMQKAGPKQVPYLQSVFICLVGTLVSSMFNNLYYFGFFWLIIALAAALAQSKWSDEAARETA